MRKSFWKYGIIAIIIISLGFKMVNVEEYIVMYFHTISLLSDLAIGGLFALLIKSNNKIKVFFENTTTLQHFFLITVAVVLFYTGNFVFNFKYGTIIHNFLISISIALIISAQAISVKKSVLHFSNIPLATKLGKYTYGIYLIHPIMYELTMLAINYYQIPNNNFINAITISLCIILMTITSSIVVYKLYESKFLKIKDKFFSN